MTPKPYTFRARLDHAWDGDTVWLIIDRGEGWESKGKYRLFGVDTPEIRGASDEEEQYAREAKAFVEELLADRDLIVSTHKGKSKYDWMAEIWLAEPVVEVGTGEQSVEYVSLAETLITHGHAVAYFGGTKQPWEERKRMQDLARGTETV